MHENKHDYEWIDQQRRAAGARYEKQVANLLRADGWQVDENGRKGLDDHGIDLIASKDGVRRYVQCKAWTHGHIYQNVIAQLFGSVAFFEGVDNLMGIEKYIYSPAPLDPEAAEVAQKLGIEFVHLDLQHTPEPETPPVQQRQWHSVRHRVSHHFRRQNRYAQWSDHH